MAKKDLKEKNRVYLRRVYRLKVLFYPLVLLFYRTGVPPLIERVLNKTITFFGVRKNIHYFFKYRDFARWFRNDFKGKVFNKGVIVFPMMAGVNGNFTMLDLMFARYFQERDGLEPLFFICDSALKICTKDGMLKSRDKYPWFCHECWKGFDHISNTTGLRVEKVGRIVSGREMELSEAIMAIDRIEEIGQCNEYTFNNLPLGRYAKKSVLRYFLTGALTGDYDQLTVYKEFLKAGAKYALATERLFKSGGKISGAIIYNGTLLFDAIIIHYCRELKIPFMTYETFMGNNTLIYKKNDEVMNLSWEREYALKYQNRELPPDAGEKVESFFSGLRRGYEMYAVLNKEHSEEKLYGKDHYVCLFTNLNFDTAVLDKNLMFTSMEDWIYSVIDFWKKEKVKKDLIIRVHPGEIKLVTASNEFIGDRIKRAAAGVDTITVLDSSDKVSSYEIMKRMDYGLIYSSTIGLEIAWEGKPCIVAGIPWFRGRGFIISPSTKEEYFSNIDRLNSNSNYYVPDRDKIIESVYYNYFERIKRFNGIKLHTPKEEPNSVYTDSESMISSNIDIFNDFRDEFNDERI